MDQKNLILAIVFSVAILLGYQWLFPTPDQPKKPPQTTEQQTQTPGTPQPGSTTAPTPSTVPTPQGAPGIAGTAPTASTTPTPTNVQDRPAALAAVPRLTVASPRLDGSIALKGGRFDDLSLKNYRLTTDPNSPEIILLSPQGAEHPYFAEFGWVADAETKVPNADTVWSADRKTFAPGDTATMRWENGDGLEFTRTVAVDANFMFTVTQKVRNTGNRVVSLHPYALISRTGKPPAEGTYLLHEGGVGVLNGSLVDPGYDDIKDSKPQSTKGGWLGITDKYWLIALVPDPAQEVSTRFTHSLRDKNDVYQADWLGAAQALAPGGEIVSTSRMFGGAKEVHLLDAYEAAGIERFSYAVDWGWFWFLTKPIFYGLDYFKSILGNFGLAILLLTVLIKLAFFPLANKSYRAMSRMKALQPKMMELRERFKEDRARLNQEMMALYKAENANPMSGCLPLLIQVPVFFALYKVLYVNIEMRHAPFYGWIHDLSAPDPTSVLTLFGLIPVVIPNSLEFLQIGVWPILMGITMYLQQKLNPAPPDPMQQKMFMLLPVVFTFMLARFPAGLVIYWAWNNVLSCGQQWLIMRRAGVKASGGRTQPAKPPAKAAKKT
jgi:YidC/Oxa1 family membrane protein insertase